MRRLVLFLSLRILPVAAAFAQGQGQWSRVYHQDLYPTTQFDLEAVAYGAGRFVAVGDAIEGGGATPGGS